MSRAFERIRELEDQQDKMVVFGKAHAKLTVLNSRDIQEVKGTTKIVCYCAGELKTLLSKKFVEFRQQAKAKREAQSSQSAASTGPVAADRAVTGGWAGVFHETVTRWMEEQTAKGGPKEDLNERLHTVIAQVKGLVPGYAYEKVEMTPSECPSGG